MLLFPQRFAYTLAVVGACWGEAALHPSLHRDLQPGLRHDVFARARGNSYDDSRDGRYDDDIDTNDFSSTLYRYRTAPLGFSENRPAAPVYYSHHAPAVPTYNAPAVSNHRAHAFPAFNAPAVNSLRGPVVFPTPSVVSINTPAVPLHHGSAIGAPVIVHKPRVSYVAPVPQPKPVQPIKSQYHVQDELGQYSFGYDAGTSTREESRDAYGNVRGSFSYIDPNGKLHVQHYVAGKDGFRVRGNNLPVQTTNEARYKRSYATFPAATGPLGAPLYDDFNFVTSKTQYNPPYYITSAPKKTINYRLESFPITSHNLQSFPTTSYNPQTFPTTTAHSLQSIPSSSYTPQYYPSMFLNPQGGYYY